MEFKEKGRILLHKVIPSWHPLKFLGRFFAFKIDTQSLIIFGLGIPGLCLQTSETCLYYTIIIDNDSTLTVRIYLIYPSTLRYSPLTFKRQSTRFDIIHLCLQTNYEKVSCVTNVHVCVFSFQLLLPFQSQILPNLGTVLRYKHNFNALFRTYNSRNILLKSPCIRYFIYEIQGSIGNLI